MTVQTGSIRLGITKQTGLDASGANPTFLFGVESGGIAVDPGQAPDDLTSGKRSSSSVFRSDVAEGVELSGRAHVKSIGLLLYAALGGLSTTGTNPYTHVITLADVLPYLTFFQEFGVGGAAVALQDCKVDELTIEWEGNKPLKVSVKVAGTELHFKTSVTAGTDETGLTTFFTPAGGTFKLDVASATPVTAKVKGGKIVVRNGVQAEAFSGSIEAGDVSEGWHVAECTFTTVPDDITTWRTLVAGDASGTSVAASPVYGSFECTFVSGDDSLKAEGTKVAFMCDLPKAQAGGRAAEVDLAGMCMLPDDDSANVKFTLVNTQASY